MPQAADPAEPALMAQWRTAMSCEELFKFTPTVERFVAEIERLPTEWAVGVCGFLEYLRDQRVPVVLDLQAHAIDAFTPTPLRKDLLKHHAQTARTFLFEEQLLGITKFAILRGADESPEVLTVEQRRAFFWALMMYADLHAAENPVTGADDAAKLEMRALAFATQEVPGNVMARAHALWVDIAARPEMRESPYYIDMPAEFAHAAGGHPVTDYIAVVMAALTHGGEAVRDSIFESLKRWGFNASSRFASSKRSAELTAALRSFAADRAEMTALFGQMPEEPRFLGVAMLPFAHRPLYVTASGIFLVISMRLLVDGLYSHAYWRVWEHLKTEHGKEGNALAARFSQFYGQVLERYVVELLRSIYDKGQRRVFAEAEAVPAQGAADAAVILDDRVILFEVTRTELRYFETLLKGDLANFDADLARTADKAKQVMDAELRVRDGVIVYPGHENAVRLPIERIVVVPEPLPRFPFVNAHLREALLAKGADPNATVISVSELEEALRAGDLAHLSTTIADWKDDPDYSDVSLHNFIHLRGRVVVREERAPFILQSGEAFYEKVIQEMAFNPATGEAAQPSKTEGTAPPPA